MRLLSLGLMVGLGGAASFAFAGPGLEKRATFLQSDEPRDRAGTTGRLVAETAELLAPFFGAVRAPALELISDQARFDERASSAGQPDATVFADFERHTVVALDLKVDGERARMIVHETTKLHVAKALGQRPAPWLETGLACCAEDAWTQGVPLGSERADAHRSARARQELRSTPNVARLVGLAAPAFERGDRVHRDVSLAWAASRHLLQGGSRAQRALAAYTQTLRASNDAARAEKAFMAVLPLADLEKSLAAQAR